MCAHHFVTEVPVNCAYDLCAHCRRCATKRVPNNVITLIHSENSSLYLIVVPGYGAAVGHLTAAAGKEDGSVKRYLIAFNSDDLGATFIGETIFMVEQFCFHTCLLLASKKIPSPR